jgi:predicted dehydrogenase
MIDAAIVGLGRWGKTLVEAVQDKTDRLRFTHAVSRNPGKLRDYAAKHQLELVGGLETVLADRRIDAVVLATPRSLHCRQIVAAAAARKGGLLSLPPVGSVRANLEAFADAVAGRASYPIPLSEMFDTVAAFEAIAEAVRSVGRIRKV